MRLIIRYPDGKRADALLLSASPHRLRIAMPGYDDLLELRRVGESWLDESGQRVSIEAILAFPERPGASPLSSPGAASE